MLTDTRLTSVLDDPLSAAKQSGKPIVLYVSNNIPIELIHACGCFPLQLPTAPRTDYSRADHYLEPNFEPMVRSALEQLLQGELANTSLLILPRTNDAWQRMYYYLCELGRSFDERVPEPFLYDLQKLQTPSSAHYNTQSTQLLADKLQALSGTLLSDSALKQAIALYNRIRSQLAQHLARRHERPSRLAGADALELFTAAQRQDPHVVEAALRDLPASAAAPGIPTILIGSTHDTTHLHQAIARAGGQVVHDFHVRGDWSFGPLIPLDKPPLTALTEHYHQRTLATRSHPLPLATLQDAAAASGARAAIFFYYAEEEALTWDYPEQAAALRSQGIRCLLLPRQPYPIGPEVDAPLCEFFSVDPVQE